jgi:hypothetical protein
MKKHTISKMFLYRHRFVIGYLVLAALFIFTLTVLPMVTPNGLSESEMESVVTSQSINRNTILEDDIVDLPYHLLQKASIRLFGLTIYSIKLPSILIGAALGVLLILLLNRWFKNNVAIMASVLAILSSSFLFISGSGTPLIMMVFWPTLLFWLGSKIQGENKPKPLYSFVFAFALLLSLFTPYMIYLAGFIVLYTLFHPHLRFTITHLPKAPFVFAILIVLSVGAFITINALKSADTVPRLLFMDDFAWANYFSNIKEAFLPFFKWSGMIESTFLAPLIGLASLALAITGLISTYHGFFASRNSIASYLVVFTIAIAGFNPNCAILLILPLAILIAHGFRYILTKWYGLFPENPYARVFGILPIAIFLSIMISSDISHFVFGYRYNPAVANEFTNDLAIIRDKVAEGSTFVAETKLEYDFYSILEKEPLFNIENTKRIHVVNKLPAADNIVDNLVTLGHIEEKVPEGATTILSNYDLTRIVTNSKSQNSDRIYIYQKKNLNGEVAEPSV